VNKGVFASRGTFPPPQQLATPREFVDTIRNFLQGCCEKKGWNVFHLSNKCGSVIRVAKVKLIPFNPNKGSGYRVIESENALSYNVPFCPRCQLLPSPVCFILWEEDFE